MEPEKKEEAPAVGPEIAEFLERYGKLVTELGVDFAVYPVYIPDENGGFRTVIKNTPISIKNQPIKSPFVAGQS